jgi:hypothetical protein
MPPNLNRWRPGIFKDPELDNFGKNIYDQVYGLLDRSLTGAGDAGFGVASGSTSVTGSKKSIATGLTSVANVVASIDNGVSVVVEQVSANPSVTAGAIDLYVWDAGVASVNARTVRWIATGTV